METNQRILSKNIFILVALICFSIFTIQNECTIQSRNLTVKTAKYNISFINNGKQIQHFYDVEFLQGETAFASFSRLSANEDLGNPEVVLYRYFGVFMKSIFGIPNSGNYFWHFYVNGALSYIQSNTYILKEGDEIQWIYSINY